ncbi:hypothetical protein UA38_17135 [Photobacterium kishitanii]|uniref:Winged helix-turn helix domain-containing protein n=1 Tax=Photobacterium kishitanii TaxID=318456 RepID=A0AAX0YS98_9GAMM|nr:hypothetical protein UB40_17315 [Photobacterium kishitanii]KJG55973.1 hypothetical protein UA38_17135 [Photobacterium kishitanii]KJG59197.1 hypothetical protein UA42_18555 [Photobacterium kishitanii]KJG64177.1 hypothetical protein UA40_18265 [Photobacterium kishitanii]KJG68277.1 hypothetical protein UA41_18155 [Photobacterium kishitanii]
MADLLFNNELIGHIMVRKLLQALGFKHTETKSRQLRERLEFAVQQNLGQREARANRSHQ